MSIEVTTRKGHGIFMARVNAQQDLAAVRDEIRSVLDRESLSGKTAGPMGANTRRAIRRAIAASVVEPIVLLQRAGKAVLGK